MLKLSEKISLPVLATLLLFISKNEANTIHNKYLLCQDEYNTNSVFGIVAYNAKWKLITASESSYGEIDIQIEKTANDRTFRYTSDNYFFNFTVEENDKVVSTLILDRFDLRLEVFSGKISLPKVLQPRNAYQCKLAHSKDELERAIERISQKAYYKKENVRNRKL